MAAQAVIAVSPKLFTFVWCIAQLFHIVCILYATSVISIHRYITAQNLQVVVDYLGHNVFGFFQPVIATLAVVVACHAVEMVRAIAYSIHAREFRFTRKTVSQNATQPHADDLIETRRPSVTSADGAVPVKTRLRWLRYLQRTLSSPFATYNITGARYESAFFLFEATEVSLQTYQAYNLSRLVSAVWINRLYAFVLISNCWSTAIVHQYLLTNHLVKRVLLVTVDSLFDVIANLIIPFVIFVPYYWQFDLALRDFPIDNYYHDVWLIQAISENQQVFVTSWLDFVSKMSPHLSVWFAVRVLKQTIVVDTVSTVRPNSVAHVKISTKASAGPTPSLVKPPTRWSWRLRLRAWLPTAKTRVRIGNTLQRVSSVASGGDGARVTTAPRLTNSQRLKVTNALFGVHTHVWHDLFFVIFGIVILVIHLHTTFVALTGPLDGNGCMLAMRPWFATEPTCASMEINCARGQHDDGMDATSFHAVLTGVDLHSLKALVLSGCARLHMPPAIQLLPALLMMKIYNTTIEQWDASAELHNAHHPNLLIVLICDSNFTTNELPVGMLGDSIPHQLVDVEFSGTNLVELPKDLHDKWPSIMYFVLERSPGITTFPETIVKMNIPQLMLGCNSIRSIPDMLLMDQAFWKLMFDGNPLTVLPNTIGKVGDLYKVGFAFTDVTTLPAWAVINSSFVSNADVPFLGYADLYAGGSPLCATLETNASSTALLHSSFHLSCSLDAPTHAYPVEREREWRAASQSEWF